MSLSKSLHYEIQQYDKGGMSRTDLVTELLIVIKEEIERLSTPQRATSAPATDESITLVALVGVLERLRSKHKTPNQWYEGWNGAIDCLIRDAKAAINQPTTTPAPESVDCLLTSEEANLVVGAIPLQALPDDRKANWSIEEMREVVADE